MWLRYFRALKLGNTARAAPLDRLSVVLAASFAVLFRGERLTLPNRAGVGLGAVLREYRA